MPQPVAPTTLVNLISTATTPVVLVTATAILLSGFTAKYNHLSDQLRALAAEHRAPSTTSARKSSICAQLALFKRRMMAMWASSVLLSVALIAFIGMILELIFFAHSGGLTATGACSLVIGLILLLLGVVTELYEIYLARLTATEELSDLNG